MAYKYSKNVEDKCIDLFRIRLISLRTNWEFFGTKQKLEQKYRELFQTC